MEGSPKVLPARRCVRRAAALMHQECHETCADVVQKYTFPKIESDHRPYSDSTESGNPLVIVLGGCMPSVPQCCFSVSQSPAIRGMQGAAPLAQIGR